MGREAWMEMECDIGGGVVVAGVRVEVVGVVEGFGVAILAMARVGVVGAALRWRCAGGRWERLDDEW